MEVYVLGIVALVVAILAAIGAIVARRKDTVLPSILVIVVLLLAVGLVMWIGETPMSLADRGEWPQEIPPTLPCVGVGLIFAVILAISVVLVAIFGSGV